MSEERWPLPASWKWAEAGEIAAVVGGGTPLAKDPTNFAEQGIPWLTPADLTGYHGVYIERGARDLSEKGYKTSSATLMPEGAVLFSSRAPIGYCAIAANPISTNQGFKSLVLANGLSPEFVRRYLLASKDYAESKASGTTFRELSGSRVAKLAVPLPPLPEQQRIVAKLDRLSARSRAARDHLARTATLAARAKQAILAAAIAKATDAAGTPPVPLGDVAIDIRYGTAKKCAYEGGARPVLRIPNVAGGRIDATDLKYADFDAKEVRKLSLVENDLLMIRSNGSLDLVGRSALVGADHVGYLFAGYLIRVRLDQRRVEPQFIQHVLSTEAARRVIERLAKSTSGVNNINSAQIASIPIPDIPLPEQREIVRRIETTFSRIDRLTAEAARAAHLLDRLDERLLAKAFRGELVPHDPNDEPAEVLLARIRATRASTPNPTRTRRKKTSA